MTTQLKLALSHEINAARSARLRLNSAGEWRHLERAHILSQAYAFAHIGVHWLMLLYGLRRGDFREVAGQLIRLLFAGPGSLLGRAPIGNTVGAKVGIFSPMEVPADLQVILIESNKIVER